MMEEKLLEALSHVDEKYIEEALPACIGVSGETNALSEQPHGKVKEKYGTVYARMKWSMVAACLCLVVFGGLYFLSVQRENGNQLLGSDTGDVSEELLAETEGIQPSVSEPIVEIVEKHALLENLEVDVRGGAGEGLLFYDMEELESWNFPELEQLPETLPVYRNLSFFDGSGVPVYLNEEELWELAETAAESLDATINQVTYERLKDCSEDYGEDERIVYLVADTEVGTVELEADGLGKISFKEPVQIPGEYRLVGNDGACKLGEEALRYLAERYADLLSLEDAVVYSNYDYNIHGDRNYTYHAYEQGDTALESFLNYHFAEVRFSPAYDKNAVDIIWFGDKRRSAEYIKDYPLMSPQEAKKLLQEGQYFNYTDPKISEMGLSGGAITEPELTYRVHNSCKLYIPYFIFYAEVPQTNLEAESLGLKDYIPYYVPAIQRGYWDEVMDLIQIKE